MNALLTLLASGTAVAGITRTAQVVAVLWLAAASVLSRSPQRRRDARRTLAVLLLPRGLR